LKSLKNSVFLPVFYLPLHPKILLIMAFDIEMIKAVYARMDERIAAARKAVGRPLTLTEKILYSHLTEGSATKSFERGKSYVDFGPDRVAMQDATAQMALLQFMQSGRPKVAVRQPCIVIT
jgi:aconitate hydratase